MKGQNASIDGNSVNKTKLVYRAGRVIVIKAAMSNPESQLIHGF